MATSPALLPSRLPWADASIAEGYDLSLKGLFRVDFRGERQKVAGPVWPKAYTENPSPRDFRVRCGLEGSSRSDVQAFIQERLHQQCPAA